MQFSRMVHVLSLERREEWCSGAFVWGYSEKVPTATGFVRKNDRVEGAIGGKRSQKRVGGVYASVFICPREKDWWCRFLSGEIRYYKGLHKVKVVTQSEGYWIVEAQEDFEDRLDGETVKVKAGEERIASPSILFKERTLPPPIKEHAYELRMEKKVKRMIEQQEKTQTNTK
jgi:hypothetical protein